MKKIILSSVIVVSALAISFAETGSGAAATGRLIASPKPMMASGTPSMMRGDGDVEDMMPASSTGDPELDKQIMALRKEMEEKVKAIRSDYESKIKALIIQKNPNWASSTEMRKPKWASSTMQQMMGTGTPMRRFEKRPLGPTSMIKSFFESIFGGTPEDAQADSQ